MELLLPIRFKDWKVLLTVFQVTQRKILTYICQQANSILYKLESPPKNSRPAKWKKEKIKTINKQTNKRKTYATLLVQLLTCLIGNSVVLSMAILNTNYTSFILWTSLRNRLSERNSSHPLPSKTEDNVKAYVTQNLTKNNCCQFQTETGNALHLFPKIWCFGLRIPRQTLL